MEMTYLKEILFEYPKEDAGFREMLDSSGLNLEDVMAKLRKEEVYLKKASEKHEETILRDIPIAPLNRFNLNVIF